MDKIPENYEDMSEEMKKQLFNSKLVQKGLAYRRIAHGLEMLKEDDPAVYDQLINGVLSRTGRVNSKETVEDILESMIDEVQEHTELMEEDEDEEDDYL